jgi:hypothetical protein
MMRIGFTGKSCAASGAGAAVSAASVRANPRKMQRMPAVSLSNEWRMAGSNH